jgi:AcrR family transcriptional regulator
MDKTDGQVRPSSPRERGATRRRLLDAAAELIAELGWGGVTTRAVAARANLPHGAVSYHFRSKQELLTEAADSVFQRAFPAAELRALEGADLLDLVRAWFAEDGPVDPIVVRVGIEAMLEQERNPALRERMTALLAANRSALADVVRANQRRGALKASVDPDGLATLLIALGDGMFLQSRIDPRVGPESALRALAALLGGEHAPPPAPETGTLP